MLFTVRDGTVLKYTEVSTVRTVEGDSTHLNTRGGISAPLTEGRGTDYSDSSLFPPICSCPWVHDVGSKTSPDCSWSTRDLSQSLNVPVGTTTEGSPGRSAVLRNGQADGYGTFEGFSSGSRMKRTQVSSSSHLQPLSLFTPSLLRLPETLRLATPNLVMSLLMTVSRVIVQVVYKRLFYVSGKDYYGGGRRGPRVFLGHGFRHGVLTRRAPRRPFSSALVSHSQF